MKKYRLSPVHGILLLTITGCITLVALKPAAHAAPSPDSYTLVWSDEFNKDGAPDPANWTFEQGFVRNHEAQWYQPQNAYCENGCLVLEAKKEARPNPLYEQGSSDWRRKDPNIEYTSACLLTRGLHSWKYGRFEMRARIDIASGLWPAFWTLGEKGQWPSNGEVDIMEYYRKSLLANIATGTGARGKALWYSHRTPIDSLGGKEWASRFHIWRMDWDDTAIRLTVDGEVLQDVPLSKLDNGDGSGVNPFRQPHYILLNLALGGDNGGDLAKTAFPCKYEIDYVRVYQKR
jgi:beta-glucanase (GH16 family)